MTDPTRKGSKGIGMKIQGQECTQIGSYLLDYEI
eukprot:CAMPEP_0171038802 /NCGR_PEP_ID=MMETSP0736-20130129/43497_1 /TAXON_ID=186038 /ORGANISM="Fragilariopsis kerguelensis, Strain L26-C5" /LENGTH=33 /DNA_ID= /DNA_START= /DNA_END= /DNA_ORIENTATION=